MASAKIRVHAEKNDEIKLFLDPLPRLIGGTPRINPPRTADGVGISGPIYDGGIRDADVEDALADNDRTAALVAAAGTEAARQIVAPSNAAKTSIAAIVIANALEIAAQTTFDGSLASYRNSVESITGMAMAEIGLLRAREAISAIKSDCNCITDVKIELRPDAKRKYLTSEFGRPSRREGHENSDIMHHRVG